MIGGAVRVYILIMGGIWALWLVSWLVAAIWASKAAQRPPLRDELPYRALHVVGALLLIANFQLPRFSFGWGEPDWVSILLLFGPYRHRFAAEVILWPTPPALAWAMIPVACAGFAFTWWARIHLGRLWSSSVGRKAEHHIVDTGPYGIVRHPIYTGILLSFFASLLLRPGWLGLAAAVVMTASFVVKLRLEERFLSAELGAEAYAAYRRRVPMLVPFWPVR